MPGIGALVGATLGIGALVATILAVGALVGAIVGTGTDEAIGEDIIVGIIGGILNPTKSPSDVTRTHPV